MSNNRSLNHALFWLIAMAFAGCGPVLSHQVKYDLARDPDAAYKAINAVVHKVPPRGGMLTPTQISCSKWELSNVSTTYTGQATVTTYEFSLNYYTIPFKGVRNVKVLKIPGGDYLMEIVSEPGGARQCWQFDSKNYPLAIALGESILSYAAHVQNNDPHRRALVAKVANSRFLVRVNMDKISPGVAYGGADYASLIPLVPYAADNYLEWDSTQVTQNTLELARADMSQLIGVPPGQVLLESASPPDYVVDVVIEKMNMRKARTFYMMSLFGALYYLYAIPYATYSAEAEVRVSISRWGEVGRPLGQGHGGERTELYHALYYGHEPEPPTMISAVYTSAIFRAFNAATREFARFLGSGGSTSIPGM